LYNKTTNIAGCQWLMPVIPATQEADIRISVPSQLWENSLRDPISKNPSRNKKGLVEWLNVQAEFKPQYHTQKNR
jgi:hypothetical protein